MISRARALGPAALLALGTLATGACVEEPAGRACDGRAVAQAEAALTLPERALVGEGAPYPADPSLAADEGRLAASPRDRRALGWRTIARVIEPVPIAADVPAATAPTLPRFRTWYDAADVGRLFRALYLRLPVDARARRARFADADVDAALAWNTRAVEESAGWPAERVEGLRLGVDSPARLAGLGGLSRVAFAPSGLRHVLRSYPEIAACAEGAPRAEPTERRAVTETLALAGCEVRRVGPWTVAEGEVATLRVAGADALTVLGPDGLAACDVGPDEPCDVTGPGPFSALVTGAADGGDAILALDLPPAPACLAGAFPPDVAIVKASWHRADVGHTLPGFDTSATALAARLADGATWPAGGDVDADPGPDAIVTTELADGRRYRLAALHVMTRELGHWLWATIWWSPTPDDDFGADRPASADEPALAGPWRGYKMCVVTAFDEGALDPAAAFADTPSLAAAVRATQGGGATWCSNPYLETGIGNAGTSCLGCHQHAATGLDSARILALPDHGRAEQRDTFPTDYVWAVTSGDRLGRDFANVIAWDDASH